MRVPVQEEAEAGQEAEPEQEAQAAPEAAQAPAVPGLLMLEAGDAEACSADRTCW